MMMIDAGALAVGLTTIIGSNLITAVGIYVKVSERLVALETKVELLLLRKGIQ